jgi:uncharacterized protein (UPF0276 family)
MSQLGHGVGLRTQHFHEFLETSPRVDWVEAISENFMGVGGRPLAVLEKVRRDRPVVLHGVSLAIGSVAPLDDAYLTQLKSLAERIQPTFVSDHLCWGRAAGGYAHDLLPLPFTEEALAHVVARVKQVQDRLDRRILLENVSSYMAFRESELTEWEFLAEVARRADCHLLLDVNNIYVSARNHGFDPQAYLAGVPVDRVKQFHLAGHQDRGTIVIDTHEGHVTDSVWDLYRDAVKRFGQVPTLIEWDEGVPELPTLLAESEKARELMRAALSERTATEVARTPSVRPGATLAPTQTAMFEWITAGAEPVGAEALVHGGALSAEERVGIYSEMYWLRMRDALREDFPSIVRELGDEDFEVLVAKYLQAHRSTHFSLSMAGRQMASFLETMTVEGAPYLSSLAALERARTECFVAPDSAVLELGALQALASAFATARLVPGASLQVLTLSHDVVSRVSDGEANVEARKTHVVVWRRDWRVLHAEVAADEADALRRVLAGQGVAEVCEAFVEREDPAGAAFAAIGSWVSEGMMASLET